MDGETPAAALIYRFIEYLTETEGYLDFIRWLNEWQHVFLAEQGKRRELYTTFEICRKHCQIKPEYVGAYNGAMEISRGYEVLVASSIDSLSAAELFFRRTSGTTRRRTCASSIQPSRS